MKIPPVYNPKKRVLIAGGGFAGLTSVKRLTSKCFQVILIDRNNYHWFQPLFYQAGSCGLEPGSIGFPFRKTVRPERTIFIRTTEVLSVSPEWKMLHTGPGDMPYDYVTPAQGTLTNYFNNSTLLKKACSIKSV